MSDGSDSQNTKPSVKPLEIHLSKDLRGPVLKIRKPEIVYPLFLDDPENGMYIVKRTHTGKILMNKI